MKNNIIFFYLGLNADVVSMASRWKVPRSNPIAIPICPIGDTRITRGIYRIYHYDNVGIAEFRLFSITVRMNK